MILLTKTANKKLLIWSILLMALLQMPNLALTPAIHGIHEAFPERALSTIQTTMALTGLISPFVAVASAFAIGRGLVTKKHVIVTGLLLVALTGALSLVAHTRFWHLVMLSCILGVGMSGYLSNGVSLIADNFPMGERQRITGFQTSFINGGGILMSLCGGLLATGSWHGGYLMLLIALPVAIVAMAGIPNVKLPRGGGKKNAGAGTGKLKLHPDIFLFGILIFVFMTIYNVIGANISTHLASLNLGNSSVSGYTTAIRMLGGAVFGLVFSRLSRKLGDFTTVLGFLALFADMFILSTARSIPWVIVGEFIGGTGFSLLLPQCLISISRVVNEQTSAIATAITSGIAPSFGSFFSAMIFTNITTALYGESTVLRYRFVAFVALGLAAVCAVIFTIRRKRKADEGP